MEKTVWNQIRGHSSHVDWFRRAIRRGRLSHGYVFAGPDGIGKRLFARTLAQCLLCQRHRNEELLACGECPACKQVAADSHPDLHWLARIPGKSQLLVEQFIGPKENRGREGLCYDLSLLPMEADRKIAIIDDASDMNDSNSEIANVFLKTLEEPQPGALIILLVSNLDSLLTTIRSRCQIVRFAPLLDTDVSDLLQQLDWVKEPGEAASLAQLSGGSLTVAAQLLDPALRELRDGMYGELARSDFNPLALSDCLTSGLDAIGGDTATQRRNAHWLIRFALEFYRNAALSLSDPSREGPILAAVQFAQRFDSRSPEDYEFILSLFERVAETAKHIDANIAVPRCLETMCDELGQQLRPASRR